MDLTNVDDFQLYQFIIYGILKIQYLYSKELNLEILILTLFDNHIFFSQNN